MDPLVVVTGYYKKTPVRPGVGTGFHIGTPGTASPNRGHRTFLASIGKYLTG